MLQQFRAKNKDILVNINGRLVHRDEEDYFRHRDYIHLNPVRHGYVEHPEECPWSSFHRHVRMGWLDPEWPGSSPVELPAIEE